MATIKVLIVEDSALVADVLKQTLESDSRVRVVGIAANGQAAVEMLPNLSPDLITMDVWMPVMDGFATVEWIMANKPTPILVITSSKLKEDVQISLRMLAAGALDVIEKPNLSDDVQWKRRQAELIAKVKLLSGVRVVTHVRGKMNAAFNSNRSASVAPPRPRSTTPLPVPNPPQTPDKAALRAAETAKLRPRPLAQPYFFPAIAHYQTIAIASSTGGPTALLQVLKKLPVTIPASILIVQHISEGFTQGLVDWLQREVSLKLKIARDGDRLEPGEVLFAPDRRDLQLTRDRRVVTTAQTKSILCPSADVLMDAVATVYGRQAIGVVLTGMGSDGAWGLKEMYEAGAYTIAQDEATSLIYGMPRVALELGGTREVLALSDIPGRLCNLLQQPLQSEDLIRPAGPRQEGGSSR